MITKNTNKKTRAKIDSFLSDLGLIICEGTYKETLSRIQKGRNLQMNRDEIIRHLTCDDCCADKASRDLASSHFGRIANAIETL